MPRANLSINNSSYVVFLAANKTAWTNGLMYVSLNELRVSGSIGMLFVFPNDTQQCFWMANTEIPLQQLWINNGTVNYAYNATPYSTLSICYTGKEVLEIATQLPNPPQVGIGTKIT